MDKKVLVLIILVSLVFLSTVALIAWQVGLTGFAVKESGDKFKVVESVQGTGKGIEEVDEGYGDYGLGDSQAGGNGGGGGRNGGRRRSSGNEDGGSTPTGCEDECLVGEKEKVCADSILKSRECGNYDSDSCLEWSSWDYVECSFGCENGKCLGTKILVSSYEGAGSFSINVEIESEKEIYACDLSLTFNPSLLKANSVEEGNFLSKNGNVYVLRKDFDNTKGAVYFIATRLGTGKGASGKGILFTIDFEEKGKGTSDLVLDRVELIGLTDSKLENVYAIVENGKVSVT